MRKIISIIYATAILLTNILFRFPVLLLLRIRLNVRYKNIREVHSIKGPCVILPNHTNQWDPFIISCAMSRPIHWVASDGVFRDSGLKALLLLCGTIPKIKEQSDMMTLERIRWTIKMGHSVGIFPEGEQNWDGRSLKTIESTAKLLRFLKVPVLVPLIKGGFITKPRWAWGVRRCMIEVSFKKLIGADEIKTMKLTEIQKRMADFIVHDDYEWQKHMKIPIAGECRAEHMELAHYICPSCEKIGELRSQANDLSCSCGYSVHVDRYGFLHYPEAGPVFQHPQEWRLWQEAKMLQKLKSQLENELSDENTVLLQDEGVTLKQAKRAEKMHTVLQGEARLYRNRIEVGNKTDSFGIFPLKSLTAITTFKQQYFEFRFKKNQYRFVMPSRNVSGYKWEVAYKILCQLLPEQK